MPVPIYPGVVLSSLGFAEGLSLLSSFYPKFVNIVPHFLPNLSLRTCQECEVRAGNKHYQRNKHKQSVMVFTSLQEPMNVRKYISI